MCKRYSKRLRLRTSRITLADAYLSIRLRMKKKCKHQFVLDILDVKY